MKNNLRILCLEDDIEDFEIINYILETGGLSTDMKRVDTEDAFIEALDTFQPDVILSDHSLPKFNSTEALQLFQDRQLQIPFILVTGAVSDEFAVNCIKMGAADYVLKSNLRRLPSAIEKALQHKETEKAKIKATAELATRNEELLKINNELDSFVYSVSHNLRAPLMSVLGLVNLAKHEDNLDSLHQFHQLIETSVYKLDDTVKEILDYSRNARQELTLEPIDFNKLITETLAKMKFMAGSENLEQTVKVDDHTAFYSDPYRLSVVLNNLISNAIKYLDPKKTKPFLAISVTIDKKKAVLVVEDNGVGINDALLPKVFDMFFRATDQKEGSGLGLYIVKEAVEKLKGTIVMESKVGVGTTCTIEIPNFGPDAAGH